MSDPQTPPADFDGAKENFSIPDGQAISELRHILIGPLEKRVSLLQDKMESDELQPEDVSRVLPEAIKHREMLDDKVGKALEASIASAIRASINKDRKILADALFPVLGPAIRKAIASVILGMLQSFNQILEHSLSIEGLKWRLEALRTKKSFAEIVLLKTLLFQVEQIFLIHQKTGIVLQHVIAKEVSAQDPDLISGMLTAIQDFVSDSFSSENDETLDTLRMGMDRSVWIERGGHALLAVVIRGTPPLNLRADFRDVLDDIESRESEILNLFEGDTEPFEIVRNRLESCLRYQPRANEKKVSPWLWVCCLSLVLLITLGSFVYIREHLKWNTYLETLKSEPGIVVTNTERSSGKYHIFGLRDAASTNPAKLLKNSGILPEDVVYHWAPYSSLYPGFLFQRIKKILKPPETTILTLEKNILYAHGSATHIWITEARKLVVLIPGIIEYRDDPLINLDLEELKTLSVKIETQRIYFDFKESVLTIDSRSRLDMLNVSIERFNMLTTALKRKKRIEIIGHTDSIGTAETNLIISRHRAERVLGYFVLKGHKVGLFITRGASSSAPMREEISETDRALNRCVSFRIIHDQ